ncbi:synaptotagmin-5-like isoform X2 [Limulus polyphemus]|uniref:Synaptotagmin-5-like isoform X2 n=1 Tax=Limulus polyphemus TaxID=6850 RepID=A0ABM1BIW9_LIMPO|nr:synaptotagmin-5-like isoform X2 [Limulus polyphemus]
MTIMTSSNKSSLSKEYSAAVYTCVSLFLLVLIGILFYVLCSKRYKLNWFEKTNLAAAEEKRKVEPSTSEAGSIESAKEVIRSNVTSSSVSRIFRPQGSDGSQGLASEDVWVPYDIHKEGAVREAAVDFGDERVPDTPLTPLGTKVSPFAIYQTGFSTAERGASPLIKYVQPTPLPSSPIRSRLTSMYTKLNHTQFDATMYQSKEAASSSGSDNNSQGSLQFSVSYNTQFSLLCVRLIQIRDLIPRDFSGTADPYAKVWLLPDIRDVRKSSVRRKTLNPHFEEDFVFDVPPAELRERTLEILIYDYDQYSRHVCMGKVQLPLDRIEFTEKTTLWKGITICEAADDQPDLGDLMFSLGYLPSAERLTVVILKARNLVSADERKKISDPYVKVSLHHGGKRYKKKKTTTQRGTLNPIFNEALTFNVTREMLRSATLEFSVMNDNILSQKENLGSVVIGPHSKGDEAAHFRDMIVSRSAVAMWHSLMPPRLI